MARGNHCRESGRDVGTVVADIVCGARKSLLGQKMRSETRSMCEFCRRGPGPLENGTARVRSDDRRRGQVPDHLVGRVGSRSLETCTDLRHVSLGSIFQEKLGIVRSCVQYLCTAGLPSLTSNAHRVPLSTAVHLPSTPLSAMLPCCKHHQPTFSTHHCPRQLGNQARSAALNLSACMELAKVRLDSLPVDPQVGSSVATDCTGRCADIFPFLVVFFTVHGIRVGRVDVVSLAVTWLAGLIYLGGGGAWSF